ncbi:MAG: hypothetical protein JOS17DRAFT_572976 [Linnemannia elongata]|nr:MAG: hypothetical protein JOS17DRAFT_572976 [Linnemannia elongata]
MYPCPLFLFLPPFYPILFPPIFALNYNRPLLPVFVLCSQKSRREQKRNAMRWRSIPTIGQHDREGAKRVKESGFKPLPKHGLARHSMTWHGIGLFSKRSMGHACLFVYFFLAVVCLFVLIATTATSTHSCYGH